MQVELLVAAALVILSGISLFRLTRRHIVALVLACLAVGPAYWVIESGSYVWASIVDGRVPFDALVMLIPVVFFSSLFALVLAPPAILLLDRTRLLDTIWTVVLASFLSAAALWAVRGQTPVEYPTNLLIGAIGGAAFLFGWRWGRNAEAKQS